MAADFSLGEGVAGKLNGTLTAGTMIRTEGIDPAVLGTTSARSVGHATGQLSGTAGGNDLNFKQGQAVSSVVKAVLDLELRRHNLGLFVRAKAWHDFELENGKRAYGNVPNGFQQNAPLSDKGFEPGARFSNAQFADAYAFGRFNFTDDAILDLRLGRQVVNWGTSQFFSSGINAINPRDYVAPSRPGALPHEGALPIGMLYANLATGRDWGMDGFVQYEFRHHVQPGCGTFFGASNYAQPGCDYVSLLGGPPTLLSDANALASSLYPKRNSDVLARDGGQYGLSVNFRPTSDNTEFRLYAMNYHNRGASIRVINPNIAGGYGSLATMNRLTDPNGLRYELRYVEDIQLYGASFATQPDTSLRFFGEIAYRPKQPINLNAADLVAAFFLRSPTSALNLSRNINAIPPGGTFDGYDSFPVTVASLGFNKSSKLAAQAIGASSVQIAGEIGWSHVAGLPDPGRLRYGRADTYGVAAIDGLACVETSVAGKSCAHDGFVTSNAWGYRLRLSANFPGALFGAALTPSLTAAHDVSGYSHDGTFSQGRKILQAGLHADWHKQYFLNILYTRISGGDYNLQTDRDNLVLAVGTRF